MEAKCPNCGFTGKISDNLIPEEGKNVGCPKCKKSFFIRKEIQSQPPPEDKKINSTLNGRIRTPKTIIPKRIPQRDNSKVFKIAGGALAVILVLAVAFWLGSIKGRNNSSPVGTSPIPLTTSPASSPPISKTPILSDAPPTNDTSLMKDDLPWEIRYENKYDWEGEENKIVVLNKGFKVTDWNEGYGSIDYSWKVDLKNNSESNAHERVEIQYLDSDGFKLDYDSESLDSFNKGSTTTITDTGTMDKTTWKNVSSILLIIESYPNTKEEGVVDNTSGVESGDKLNITVVDFKTDWYLNQDLFQKESLYLPRITLSIRNDTGKVLSGLKLKATFLEQNNKIFGDDTEYVDDLMPGYTSSSIFIKSAMGFVYNGYNKETIFNNTYNVELYAIYKSKTYLLKKFLFSSHEGN